MDQMVPSSLKIFLIRSYLGDFLHLTKNLLSLEENLTNILSSFHVVQSIEL